MLVRTAVVILVLNPDAMSEESVAWTPSDQFPQITHVRRAGSNTLIYSPGSRATKGRSSARQEWVADDCQAVLLC